MKREILIKLTVNDDGFEGMSNELMVETAIEVLASDAEIDVLPCDTLGFTLRSLSLMLDLKRISSTIFQGPHGTLFLCTKHGFVFKSTSNEKLYKELLYEL